MGFILLMIIIAILPLSILKGVLHGFFSIMRNFFKKTIALLFEIIDESVGSFGKTEATENSKKTTASQNSESSIPKQEFAYSGGVFGKTEATENSEKTTASQNSESSIPTQEFAYSGGVFGKTEATENSKKTTASQNSESSIPKQEFAYSGGSFGKTEATENSEKTTASQNSESSIPTQEVAFLSFDEVLLFFKQSKVAAKLKEDNNYMAVAMRETLEAKNAVKVVACVFDKKADKIVDSNFATAWHAKTLGKDLLAAFGAEQMIVLK